jgi:hypothetical protein
LSYKYTGYIDDFKVYNRALTTTDVSAIYNLNYIPKGTIVNGIGKQLIDNKYEYYVFTDTSASSTLSFSRNANFEYLIVAAGGNGGADFGAGGGAGGVVYGSDSITSSNQIIINVGKPANAIYNAAVSGGNSTITFNSNTITANGGGAGCSQYSTGSNGGSGGGAGSYGGNSTPKNGIAGQGNNGGNAGTPITSTTSPGGGGGAGGVGGSGGYSTAGAIGGAGGNGTNLYSEWIIFISSYMNTIYTNWSQYTISGGIGYIASGGAAGTSSFGGSTTGRRLRTIGGGGDGGSTGSNGLAAIYRADPTSGIPNTGGGGGGRGGNHPGTGLTVVQGGSGIVIIRVIR